MSRLATKFAIKSIGNIHYITWPVVPVSRAACNIVTIWVKNQTNYSPRVNLRKLMSNPMLKNLSKEQIISLRNIAVKDKIIKNYSRMNTIIPKIAREYAAGEDIITLSRKYDFPPLNLLRGILLQSQPASTLYKIFANKQDPTDILSARDLAQFRRAELYDAESTFNQSTIAQIAAENEATFVEFFKSQGIKLRIQDELAAEQVKLHGRAINTPDILFVDEVHINGQRVHWIDYKDYIGTTINFLYSSNTSQAARYVAEWGSGAMCYHRSFIEGTIIPGTILLDVASLPINLKTIV